MTNEIAFKTVNKKWKINPLVIDLSRKTVNVANNYELMLLSKPKFANFNSQIQLNFNIFSIF